MNSLRIGGLASGMDTETMVRDMMKIQRLPLQRLEQDKQVWQWKQESYRSINISLLALRNKAFDMKLQSPYLAKQVQNSNEAVLEAKAGFGADGATYHLHVQSLATTASTFSREQVAKEVNMKDSIASWVGGVSGEDKFSFTVQGTEGSVVFEFSYGDSLEKVVSQVNSHQDAGVSMFFDDQSNRMVITGRQTGKTQEINIADNHGSNFIGDVLKIDTLDKDGEFYQAGSNAVVTINGLETERSSNNFQINGVDFNLKAVGTARIQIEHDVDQVVENIKEFVELYNKTIEEVYGHLNEESFRGFPPLTAEQRQDMSDKDIELWEEKAKSGLLQRDTVLASAMNSLRRAMTSTIKGGNIENIFSLGMKTGSYHENGKIYLDEEKLRAAVEKDPEGVMKLFTNDGEDQIGLAQTIQDELDHAMKQITNRAGSATTIYDDSFIGKAVRNINDQMFRLEERLARVEERYWQQFVSMEQALQSMYQQGDWLAQQMMAMGG